MIFSYARVSTLEQAADGATSLAEQERRNHLVAQLRGARMLDFVSYVDAGVSGSVPLRERPKGKEMLAAAQKGDTIVAVKLDRLFRSAIDALTTAEDLKKKGIELILSDIGVEPISSNGAAKLFFGILAQVADFERERIAERMSDGKKAKRRNGGHAGGHAPRGFKVVGSGREARLELDPEERKLIRTALQFSLEDPSPWVIAKKLNKEGFRDRAGNLFRVPQVQRLLSRAHG